MQTRSKRKNLLAQVIQRWLLRQSEDIAPRKLYVL